MKHPASKIVRRVRSWPRVVLWTIGVVAVLLLAVRLALPSILKNAVNHRLERIPGYTGHVDRIGVHLWRGAYSLHGFDIKKQNGRLREPIFHANDIDFSLAWGELLHRKIVSQIEVKVGQITFVQGPTEAESQTDLDRRWQDVIESIFPIDITRLEVTDGLLRYINTTREPTVNLFVTHMHAIATGLRNRPGESDSGEFPAKILINGESLGGGTLNLKLNAEPLADQPHFHLDLKLDQVNLPALNESLKAYAKVDVSRGTFRLVAEMAGKDGGFQGYVKPFFEDLDFSNLADKEESLGRRIWEKIVAAFVALVKNKPRDQLATRIPFEGKFGDPKFGLLATIGNLFRHGFVRAFNPTVEGSVHADNVKPDGTSANGKDVAENPKQEPVAEKKPAQPDPKR